jgi:Zn-dependent metalloprotease
MNCTHNGTAPICFIAPPHILARMIDEGTPEQRDAAIQTLAASASMRTRRAIVAQLIGQLGGEQARTLNLVAPPAGENLSVYDVEHGGRSDLPGAKKRGQGDPDSDDPAVNQAYEGADQTYCFYRDVFNRNSLDDAGLELVSSVHYSVRYENAFWDGRQMVYGDGGDQMFIEGALTTSLDVIAHELTHGLTQYTANLNYSKQSGAANEHFSDVFGSLVKQYHLGQDADQADWLIGQGILKPDLGEALRSMKAPGTAFKWDDQPATMDDYKDLPDDTRPENDNGGVHINSGIPNHAFYLVATALGGKAWEKAGRIWYTTLTERLGPDSDFTDLANATVDVAGSQFGEREQEAVQKAWQDVKVLS